MNRKCLLLALVLGLSGMAAGQGTPPARTYTIEQLTKFVQVGGMSLSPDEKKVLYHSNESGQFNLYEVPFAGGPAQQLTFSKTSAVLSLAYLPDGRILYSSDEGDPAFTALYIRNTDGTSRKLTSDPEAQYRFMGLSHDRKSLYYASNERVRLLFDVYEIQMTDLKAEMIFRNAGDYLPVCVSPDRRFVALNQTRTGTDSDVYLYDRQYARIVVLTAHPGEALNTVIGFTPDSQKILFFTDQDSPWQYIREYDLNTGETKIIEQTSWDITGAGLSQTGKYRFTAINQDARTLLKLWRTDLQQAVKLPAGITGSNVVEVSLSYSETKMLVSLSSAQSPADLYAYDLPTGRLNRLTRSLNPAVKPDDLATGEVVRFKSFGGLDIPAILYKPRGLAPGEKRPALVYLPGSTGAQIRQTYNPHIQYLVGHGYWVLAVNKRGSQGYGKVFGEADDCLHGEADLRDCLEARKVLMATGQVDPARIGIMGTSYGGYLSLAALTFAPDAFRVGVDLFGVNNWLHTLNNIPVWWGRQQDALFREMGHPKVDSAALRNKSPLFFADRIRKPLLVVQGGRDQRVSKPETDKLVATLKQRSVPVTYLVLDNEGHGITRPDNEVAVSNALIAFLNKYLWGKPL